MADEEVILLDFWSSNFAMRVKIALSEKGVKYECWEEDLLKKKSELLLEINPVLKNVPVLIHNGKPDSETLMRLGVMKLLHCCPLRLGVKYQAKFWADLVDKKFKTSTKNGEEQEAAKKELIETLKLLEGELGEKSFFGGQQFGYLDIALIVFRCWFYGHEITGNFSIEAECPKIIAWSKRCMEKDSVAGSLADQKKIYGFMLELRKMFGVD